MTVLARVQHEINEQPVLLVVTYFCDQPGMPMMSAPSDWDYYGYTEVEYAILDPITRNRLREVEKAVEADTELAAQIEDFLITYMRDRAEAID